MVIDTRENGKMGSVMVTERITTGDSFNIKDKESDLMRILMTATETAMKAIGEMTKG